MRIRSPFQCGYSREGRAVLQEGVNDLDMAKLGDSERLFVEELVKAGVVERIDELAAAPESGHRLLAPPPPVLESAEVDDDFEIVMTTQAPVTAAAARAGRKRK